MDTIERRGFEVICAPMVQVALELAGKRPFAVVFCDRELTDGSCSDFLLGLRERKIRTRVVVISRTADWDQYLEAMRLGAFDMIPAPCQPDDVEWTLFQASREERNRSKLETVRPESKGAKASEAAA